jgi:hypothetical protein
MELDYENQQENTFYESKVVLGFESNFIPPPPPPPWLYQPVSSSSLSYL